VSGLISRSRRKKESQASASLPFLPSKNNFFEKNKRIPGIGAEYKDSEHIFD